LLKDMATFTGSVVHNEAAFRYLLESESKRSEQSGYFYQILLVYQTNVQEDILQMDSDVAAKVIAALSQTLRDTDYIGWYREQFIVAGVLTVVRQESMAQVSSHIQKRMADALQLEPCIAANPRLQIQVCRYHELEGFESRAGTVVVN